jgi:hypothetical protein
MKNQKCFYVPWEGYSQGERSERDALDVLCLQGPHTREDAHRIAAEMRAEGRRASVIDASNSLRWAEVGPELLAALERIVDGGCPTFARDTVLAAIAKAKGRDK